MGRKVGLGWRGSSNQPSSPHKILPCPSIWRRHFQPIDHAGGSSPPSADHRSIELKNTALGSLHWNPLSPATGIHRNGCCRPAHLSHLAHTAAQLHRPRRPLRRKLHRSFTDLAVQHGSPFGHADNTAPTSPAIEPCRRNGTCNCRLSWRSRSRWNGLFQPPKSLVCPANPCATCPSHKPTEKYRDGQRGL